MTTIFSSELGLAHQFNSYLWAGDTMARESRMVRGERVGRGGHGGRDGSGGRGGRGGHGGRGEPASGSSRGTAGRDPHSGQHDATSAAAPDRHASARSTRSPTQMETRRSSAGMTLESPSGGQAVQGAAEARVGRGRVAGPPTAAAAACTPPPAPRNGSGTHAASPRRQSTGKRSAGGRLADAGSYAAMQLVSRGDALRAEGGAGSRVGGSVGERPLDHELDDADSTAGASSRQRGTSAPAGKRPANNSGGGRARKSN